MIAVNIEKARAIAAQMAAAVADPARRLVLVTAVEQAATVQELAALVEQIKGEQ